MTDEPTEDQRDALQRIGGIQRAATVLLQRLFEKDPAKWLHVIMMSPTEIVPWPAQPDFLELGTRIKTALDDGTISIRMRPDGVVTGRKNRAPGK